MHSALYDSCCFYIDFINPLEQETYKDDFKDPMWIVAMDKENHALKSTGTLEYVPFDPSMNVRIYVCKSFLLVLILLMGLVRMTKTQVHLKNMNFVAFSGVRVPCPSDSNSEGVQWLPNSCATSNTYE